MLRTARNFGDSKQYAIKFSGESRTIQSQAEDADINVLVRRFGITGGVPVVAMPPVFQEFEDVFDFQSAMNVLTKAKNSFMELDAEVRLRFGNDPGRFVKFVDERDAEGNRVNVEELRKMGIALPPQEVVEPPVMRVEVVNGDKPA